MPFRDEITTSVAADPLARFMDLHAALEADRKWYQDSVPRRLAAVCLIPTAGEAGALVEQLRRVDAGLAARIRWTEGVSAEVRLVIAAHLLKYGEAADAFLDEVARVRALFRAAALRNGGVHEYVAVLLLRRVLGRGAEAADVARFGAIYEALKKHHWWLTGPDDFPVCAMLAGREEEPEQIGAGADALYRALHERADLWRGTALHTSANVLYLARVPPLELAERFVQLREALAGRGVRVGQAQYDEVAILCFLAWPVEKIVATVLEFRDRMREAVAWLGKADALGLAASLALVRLAGQDGTLASLADAKLLLDMQEVIDARASGTS
ncbi:MAG: DUF4003 family protein [Myxococcales bacterium]|nr:DUF4003 family protein [Myxococcales bacterium]